MDFKQYVKKEQNYTEMAPWTPDFDMSKVRSKETPAPGDMIARNPKDRDDMWLVKKAYFEDNYEEMDLSI